MVILGVHKGGRVGAPGTSFVKLPVPIDFTHLEVNFKGHALEFCYSISI